MKSTRARVMTIAIFVAVASLMVGAATAHAQQVKIKVTNKSKKPVTMTFKCPGGEVSIDVEVPANVVGFEVLLNCPPPGSPPGMESLSGAAGVSVYLCNGDVVDVPAGGCLNAVNTDLSGGFLCVNVCDSTDANGEQIVTIEESGLPDADCPCF